MRSDEELVRRIQNGDEEAWADFLERYSDLIFSRARDYCRLTTVRTGSGDLRDERDEIYLFMAESVRRSLKSFRLSCHPKTWIISVIGNRKQVIKAYLMLKAPARSDVRLPKIMESRSELEKKIFRRLIWGIEPVHIAWDLQVDESQCLEVESLLARHSPRVFERIQGNRRALEPKLSIDEHDDEEGDRPRIQIADIGPSPEEEMESRAAQRAVQEALKHAYGELAPAERRVLILLYNHGLSAAQVVEMADTDANLALSEIDNVNRCYYVKDKALAKIADIMVEKLENFAGERAGAERQPRELLRRIEELLRDRGFPLRRASE